MQDDVFGKSGEPQESHVRNATGHPFSFLNQTPTCESSSHYRDGEETLRKVGENIPNAVALAAIRSRDPTSQRNLDIDPARGSIDMEELLGCWREAQRADAVADGLLRIRTILDQEFHDQIS